MIACFGGGGYDNGRWGVLEQYRAPRDADAAQASQPYCGIK